MGKGDNKDRSYVYESGPSLPYWREPVMYQVPGDFSIRLPTGRWRIAVEHGNELLSPLVGLFDSAQLDDRSSMVVAH